MNFEKTMVIAGLIAAIIAVSFSGHSVWVQWKKREEALQQQQKVTYDAKRNSLRTVIFKAPGQRPRVLQVRSREVQSWSI